MKKVTTFLAIGVMLIAVSCQKQIGKEADLQQSSQIRQLTPEQIEAMQARKREALKATSVAIKEKSDKLMAERQAKTGTSKASAKKMLIKVPQDYPTIQEAVDNAADGATINVSGSYTESVNICGYSNLTINGGGSAVLTSTEEVFFITHSTSVVIKGFNITGSPSQNYTAAIMVDNSQQIEIKNNDLSFSPINQFGVYLNYSGNCSIKNNNFHDNPADAFAIALYQANHNTISFNQISKISEGIILSSSSENNVQSNSIIGDGFHNITGIGIGGYEPTNEPANSNVIQMNEVSGAVWGISIFGLCSDNMLKGNQTNNNRDGISLASASSNGTVSGTRISDCICNNNYNYGLLFDGATNNLVTNTIADNNTTREGFYLDARSSNNTINNCEASGNGTCDYKDEGTNNVSQNNTFGTICN